MREFPTGKLRWVVPEGTRTSPPVLQADWEIIMPDGYSDLCTSRHEWRDVPVVVVSESKPPSAILAMSVGELEVSVRSINVFANENILTIGDLVQKTEQDMLRTANFGRVSLREVKEELARFGLHFGMKVPD